MSSTVVVHAPDGDLPALRFAPETPNGAAVVVVQEIFGVSDYIVRRCEDLAGEGYVVYAPVLYARLATEPVLDPSSPDYLPQGMAASQALDWDGATRDVAATVAVCRTEPGIGAVGLLGFCYGGGLAFTVAAHTKVDALVSYYGSSLPGLLDLAALVTAPQLHHWGTDDSFIGPEAQATARGALESSPGVVDWRVYAGAGHAFDNDETPFQHAAARRVAWPVTLDFLASHLVGKTSIG